MKLKTNKKTTTTKNPKKFKVTEIIPYIYKYHQKMKLEIRNTKYPRNNTSTWELNNWGKNAVE